MSFCSAARFTFFACAALGSSAQAQLEPGDRLLVGHASYPYPPVMLITDRSFATRTVTLTGLQNVGGIDAAAYDQQCGRLFVLSTDVYEVQINGLSAVATYYGNAYFSPNEVQRTLLIGHNGYPVAILNSTGNRQALHEIVPSGARPLFPTQIGDRICGAAYDPVEGAYFLHTTPTQFPATPQLWKVDPAGNARLLVASFPYCANQHTDLVPDGLGGVYVVNGNPTSGILHANAAGLVSTVLQPPVNQYLSPASRERGRAYVFAESSDTYLVDLATGQTLPQWGNLAAFQNGEMTGLIAVPDPCAGSAAAFGSGCPDRNGVDLRLAVAGCAEPGAALGMRLEMNHAAPFLLFAGTSRTVWLGVQLPIDLGPFGGGTCRISTSQELVLGPFANTGSRPTFPVGLERDPALHGVTFFVQGGIFDAAANPLGLVTSNGVAIAIG